MQMIPQKNDFYIFQDGSAGIYDGESVRTSDGESRDPEDGSYLLRYVKDGVTISETEPVIHMNCILNSGNTDLSSGYNQLIIRINSVFVCCIQRQGAAAVDRQVVMCVYDTAGFIRQSFIRIARSACHAVFLLSIP